MGTRTGTSTKISPHAAVTPTCRNAAVIAGAGMPVMAGAPLTRLGASTIFSAPRTWLTDSTPMKFAKSAAHATPRIPWRNRRILSRAHPGSAADRSDAGGARPAARCAKLARAAVRPGSKTAWPSGATSWPSSRSHSADRCLYKRDHVGRPTYFIFRRRLYILLISYACGVVPVG